MKVEVIKPFADKDTHKMYEVGARLEFEAERATLMIKKKVVKSLEPPKKPKKEGKKDGID